MQCIRPLKANLNNEGSITFQKTQAMKGLESFQIPCRKCLPCRLNNGREKAIRAWHESQMHDRNIFLTLTYKDDHLESSRLIYEHVQSFMSKLRSWLDYNEPGTKIDRMVTGEYGEKNKRPHWHLIIFNWSPPDGKLKKETDRGDNLYTSKIIQDLWQKGSHDYGAVTIDSASYVGRYAAKKLTHGRDQDHNFHPIHKTPSHRGMGRLWIEKYYKQTFENGFVVLPNGELSKIPRYYLDWAKKHHPKIYEYYVTNIQPKIIQSAILQKEREDFEYLQNHSSRALTRPKIKETILKLKFQRLQERLKL